MISKVLTAGTLVLAMVLSGCGEGHTVPSGQEEQAADPAKEDTGLFFFRGDPGARFAVCNAGGAFAYVGAMHDSFPHALKLSKQGYNAFALIYCPGAQTPAKIWPGPSPLFLIMPRSWRRTPAATPSGAARQVHGWRPGLAPMALRRLAAMICPGLEQSSCST